MYRNIKQIKQSYRPSSLCILITIGLFNWRLSFVCLLGNWFLLGDLVPLGTIHWLLGTFYTPLLHFIHPCWENYERWEITGHFTVRDILYTPAERFLGDERLPAIYTPLFFKYSDKLEVVCRNFVQPWWGHFIILHPVCQVRPGRCLVLIRYLNISSRRFCL